MVDEETTGERALRYLGLNAPDADQPFGSALIASIIGGLVVGGLFLWLRGPEVASFVFVLAIAQGIYREIARSRKARAAKAARDRGVRSKKKKR